MPIALLAIASAGSALVAALALDLPLRDPDNAAGPMYVRLPAVVVLLMAVDILPRAFARRRTGPGFTRAVRDVVLERWSRPRLKLVVVGLISFYLTYVGYRNLKAFLPFAREGTADESLLALDAALGLGSAPATLLHSVLGTGIAAHALSTVYVAFLAFVPLSLGVALVWSRRLRSGYLYVTVLCLNWLLGALSYYLVPSLGPVFAQPQLFADLPTTHVTQLQEMLVSDRRLVLGDPQASGPGHGIAGFASLHVSIVFSAVLVAHLLGLSALVRRGLWLFLGMTVLATVYFGWHYLVDDVAGLVIGTVAVWLGARATGHLPAEALARRLEPAARPVGARAAERVSAFAARFVRRGIAATAIALLAVVVILRQGEEVARGNLLPTFDSYEVTRVSVLGAELYVDRSAGIGDLLTAAALALTAAMLLHAGERLGGQARRAFVTAAWGALFLAADDLLSAHETIGHNLPVLARLPIVDHPDDVVLAVYAVVVGSFLWQHRALLDDVDRRPWTVAGISAGLALLHDVLPVHLRLLEEGLEVLAGVALVVGVARLAAHHAITAPAATSAPVAGSES